MVNFGKNFFLKNTNFILTFKYTVILLNQGEGKTSTQEKKERGKKMTREIIESIINLEKAMEENGINNELKKTMEECGVSYEKYMDGSASFIFSVTEKKSLYFDFDTNGNLEDIWEWENK